MAIGENASMDDGADDDNDQPQVMTPQAILAWANALRAGIPLLDKTFRVVEKAIERKMVLDGRMKKPKKKKKKDEENDFTTPEKKEVKLNAKEKDSKGSTDEKMVEDPG